MKLHLKIARAILVFKSRELGLHMVALMVTLFAFRSFFLSPGLPMGNDALSIPTQAGASKNFGLDGWMHPWEYGGSVFPSPIWIAISAMVQFMGIPIANALIMITLTFLSYFTCFKLAKVFINSDVAAFAGGMTYAWNPASGMLISSGQQLMLVGYSLAPLLAYWITEGKNLRGVLILTCLVAVFATSSNLAYVAVSIPIFMTFIGIRFVRHYKRNLSNIIYVALTGLLSVVLLFPYYQYLRNSGAFYLDVTFRRPLTYFYQYAYDDLLHALVGVPNRFISFSMQWERLLEGVPYFSIIILTPILAFGGLALWRKTELRRIGMIVTLCGLASLLLSMGPNSIVGEAYTGLFVEAPFVSAMRVPLRWSYVLFLMYGLMISLAFEELISATRSVRMHSVFNKLPVRSVRTFFLAGLMILLISGQAIIAANACLGTFRIPNDVSELTENFENTYVGSRTSAPYVYVIPDSGWTSGSQTGTNINLLSSALSMNGFNAVSLRSSGTMLDYNWTDDMAYYYTEMNVGSIIASTSFENSRSFDSRFSALRHQKDLVLTYNSTHGAIYLVDEHDINRFVLDGTPATVRGSAAILIGGPLEFVHTLDLMRAIWMAEGSNQRGIALIFWSDLYRNNMNLTDAASRSRFVVVSNGEILDFTLPLLKWIPQYSESIYLQALCSISPVIPDDYARKAGSWYLDLLRYDDFVQNIVPSHGSIGIAPITTMGNNSLEVKATVKQTASYSLLLRTLVSPSSSMLTITIDGKEFALNPRPMNESLTLMKWIPVATLNLTAGDHVISIKRASKGDLSVDALSLVRQDLWSRIYDVTQELVETLGIDLVYIFPTPGNLESSGKYVNAPFLASGAIFSGSTNFLRSRIALNLTESSSTYYVLARSLYSGTEGGSTVIQLDSDMLKQQERVKLSEYTENYTSKVDMWGPLPSGHPRRSFLDIFAIANGESSQAGLDWVALVPQELLDSYGAQTSSMSTLAVVYNVFDPNWKLIVNDHEYSPLPIYGLVTGYVVDNADIGALRNARLEYGNRVWILVFYSILTSLTIAIFVLLLLERRRPLTSSSGWASHIY